MGHQGRNSAFSLVELIIVVVIIGIIASIATPRLSSAKSAATRRKAFADAAVLQKAIDLYDADHLPNSLSVNSTGDACNLNGELNPGACLIFQTTEDGKLIGDTDKGPYLKVLPTNQWRSPIANKFLDYNSVEPNSPVLSVAHAKFGWVLYLENAVGVMISATEVELLDGTKLNLGDLSHSIPGGDGPDTGDGSEPDAGDGSEGGTTDGGASPFF